MGGIGLANLALVSLRRYLPVQAKFIAGHRVPFLEGTEFGVVHGEVIITSQSDAGMTAIGIECKVKQVTIKREFFGMEEWGTAAAMRVTGEVHADFLPITSDRTDFIKDAPEYCTFQKIMTAVMERVRKILDEVSDQHENRRARRTLSDVLERVKKALLLNPDYCPEGLLPIGDPSSEKVGKAAEVSSGNSQGEEGKRQGVKLPEQEEEVKPQEKKKRERVQVKRLTPTAVIKHLKMGTHGISCCLDHFGKEGPISPVY